MTQLPKGIERDDTVHGRIYYTRVQLMRYAKECVNDYITTLRQPEPQPARGSAVDDLMSSMGIR